MMQSLSGAYNADICKNHNCPRLEQRGRCFFIDEITKLCPTDKTTER
jgi:hypothetical protein